MPDDMIPRFGKRVQHALRANTPDALQADIGQSGERLARVASKS